MTAAKRNAREGGVIDLWHRPARRGETVYWPADQTDGPTWCVDPTHYKTPGTKVCTTRHGRGMRWRAAWVDEAGNQKAKACKNKADAQAHLDGITTQRGTGTYTDPQRAAVTFGTLAEAWHKTKANRAPKTVAGYRGLLDVVILPKWQSYRLRDIDHEGLQTWFTWLSTDPAARQHPKKSDPDAGLSPVRVIQTHQVVHQIFDYAIRSKYLATNPADRIALPGKPQSKDLALTHEQVRLLAYETANAPVRMRRGMLPSRAALAPMVRFLAYTGLRFGEAAALRVRDVDIDKRLVTVEKSITGVRGRGRLEGPTKTHQKRAVPILVTECVDELRKATEGRGPGEFLFPGPDGNAMTNGWFRVRLDKAVEKLGYEGVTPNTFRHTAGSLAISESTAGNGVLLASRLLGHRNPNTTANVYSHVIDGDWERLATAYDEATRPATS